MSSGSASQLVNGENENENPRGYEYGDRKERNECGAAGSTASTVDALEPTSSVTPLCTPPPPPPPPSPPPPSPPPFPIFSGGSRSIYTCNSTPIPIASTCTTTSAIITINTTTTATFPTTTCIASTSVAGGAGSIGIDTYTIDTNTTASDLCSGAGITVDFVVSGVSVDGDANDDEDDDEDDDDDDGCATSGGSLGDIGVSRNISVAAVVTASNEFGGGSGVVGVNAAAVSGVLVSSVEFRDIGDSEFGRPVNLEEIRAGGGGQPDETTDSGATERFQERRTSSTSAERQTSAARTSTPTVSYDDNMVAAMNEHLSTSSATSGVRTSTASTTTAAGGNPGNNNNNNNNNNNACSRNEFQSVDEDGKPAAGILSFPCDFDHMYASMTDGSAPAAATATSALGVSPLRGNEPRQNDLTEVKHLKELLLLHLDLIQQQSEQIVTKDKLLAALRQENETLKLRLERMDRRVNLQKLRSESSENCITSEHIGACSPPSVNSVNVPSTSELHRSIQSENSNSQYNESFKIRLNTSGGITTVKQEPNDGQTKHEAKLEGGNESRLEWEEKKKRRSDPTPLSGGTKRKRGVSCSSTISNDASSTIQDKALGHDGGRKSDRKGKPLTKKECFLTTEEHYYTAVGDSSYTLNLKESNPMESGTSLEVPNWRVKIYTSCYTMEGTENLDDEIFNKRHLKLENDERRRKRWDVQRIREQRHIEKLKQRQERQNHQATCYNTNHTGPCPSTVEEEAVTSLWPDVEQIQSLQVDPQLPVTAFGAPIPSFTPSEFSLPWSNTPRSTSRRPKRSTSRRKSTRR